MLKSDFFEELDYMYELPQQLRRIDKLLVLMNQLYSVTEPFTELEVVRVLNRFDSFGYFPYESELGVLITDDLFLKHIVYADKDQESMLLHLYIRTALVYLRDNLKPKNVFKGINAMESKLNA